jgi:hypothetical protein
MCREAIGIFVVLEWSLEEHLNKSRVEQRHSFDLVKEI